jgi:hypothetical protein
MQGIADRVREKVMSVQRIPTFRVEARDDGNSGMH